MTNLVIQLYYLVMIGISFLNHQFFHDFIVLPRPCFQTLLRTTYHKSKRNNTIVRALLCKHEIYQFW